MSSISGTSALSVRQVFSQLSRQKVTNGHIQAGNTNLAATTKRTGDNDADDTGSGTGSLQDQIQAAVLQAIKDYISTGSSSSTTSGSTSSANSPSDSANGNDLLSAIKEAVDKTLKANGIDPSKLPPPPPPGGDLAALLGQSSSDGSNSSSNNLLDYLQQDSTNGATGDASLFTGFSGAAATQGLTSGSSSNSNLTALFNLLPAGSLVNQIA